MELSNDYLEQLKNVDLQWDFEYYEFLDGDDEPGLYFLRGEASRAWKKAKGWSQDEVDMESLIEFTQTQIGEIQANAISNQSCSEYDKILLDSLLEEM